MNDKRFTSFENRGLQITFANGYIVSIQFGHGNYCSACETTCCKTLS